jgi:hypothetical protein
MMMMMTTTAPSAVLEFARGHPGWPVRFVAVYLGNPLIFIAYMLAMGDSASQDGKSICGFKTFKTVAFNTSRINLILYVLITLPLYAAWFWAQIHWIVPFFLWLLRSSKTLNVDTYCARQAGVGACLAAIPGLLSMLVWSTTGMEGNVMGFLFALPLLVAAIAYIILWFVAVGSSLEYQQVLQYDDDAAVSMSPSSA